MKQVHRIEYESIRGRRFETPKGALIDDFESVASDVIIETVGEGACIASILIRFLEKAAAHPARFGRRLRRLNKIRQAVLDCENAESKQPDDIPF